MVWCKSIDREQELTEVNRSYTSYFVKRANKNRETMLYKENRSIDGYAGKSPTTTERIGILRIISRPESTRLRGYPMHGITIG